jgi:CheY-like chemotaxis protein
MFTTSSQDRERQIAKELGADGFITKPSEYKALKELISSVVNN